MAEAAEPLAAADREFFTYDGPKAGTKYPVKVRYCGECSMPIEYCEFYPNYEKCKKWLESNLPDEFERLVSVKEGDAGGDTEDGEKKKRQTRGGKGTVKAKKKSEPQGVKLATSKRGKKKMVTIVMGLASYDIDLKDASKFFANKFACGSTIQGEDEIVIQGDVKDDLFDILPEKWKIYCEFYPNYEKCKKWLESNLPDEFERLVSVKEGDAGGDTEDGEKKKRQTRGGKGTVKAKKKSEPQGVKLATSKRGKKKMVTIVMGLASYDIDLKDASKFFANKFACGSTIQGEDEIVIQGDVKDDLFDILPEKWKIINEDDIDDIGEIKKG